MRFLPRERYAKMAETVSLPIWIVAVAGAFFFWAILDRLLFPSLRWLFRRRVNRVIDELNTHLLRLQIHPFQRTKRQVLIDRLTYDPQVMESVYRVRLGMPMTRR